MFSALSVSNHSYRQIQPDPGQETATASSNIITAIKTLNNSLITVYAGKWVRMGRDWAECAASNYWAENTSGTAAQTN